MSAWSIRGRRGRRSLDRSAQRSILISRRELPGLGLAQLVLRRPAFARAVAPNVQRWARLVRERCADLRRGTLAQQAWRAELARLYHDVPLAELLAAIDFERVAATMHLPDDDAANAPLPSAGFGQKLFGMRRGRAVAPHGHDNMVSAHLVVRGRVRVRQYDRIRDEADHLLVRPSRDEVQSPGQLTSISDRRDNIHWLVADSDPAFTFDVIVDALDPSLPYPYRQIFLHPDRASPAADGCLRMPRLPVAAAVAKYGKHA